MLSLPPGIRTNAVLRLLLDPVVFGYWLFREPKHKGIEIADSLMLWDDAALLFEAKTRTKPARDDASWIRSKLRYAIGRFNDRARMLREGRVSELRNRWRGVLTWDPSAVKWYYGVVVLNHLSDPYDPLEVASEAYKASEIPVQVFSLFDLAELLRVVNTAPDFLAYYALRWAYVKRFKTFVHREFDTYQGVLSYWVELVPHASSLPLSGREILDAREFQVGVTRAVLRSKDATEEDYRTLAESFLLDIAIGSLVHKADKDASGKRVGSAEHRSLIEIVGALAELSRRRRAFYAGLWREAAAECRRAGRMAWRSGYSPQRHRSYVFGAFRPGDEGREQELTGRAILAMADNRTTSCVAIGADAQRIEATFDGLLAMARGESHRDLRGDEILVPKVAYVDVPGVVASPT